MKDNVHFSRQRRPSREAIDALCDMYAKNKELKNLVKVFNLDLRTATVQPISTETEKAARRNNSREIIKQNTMSKPTANTGKTTSKFNNEVPEMELEKFVKFENEGDAVEGFITGETKPVKNGEKTSDCFKMNVDGEDMLLPSNVKLNNKLKNALKINAETVESEGGIEVQITYDGMIKVEGVTNKMKSFTVRTA